ncbi:MAG: alpha/beta hydrolase, partial [Verrucomicrobiota bacterium]|nr:alpha/beta hydrolase [Verrucomicrobiota bacterium]
AQKDIGTTALVFPGGAYNILATDIEGTEICEWLNSLGVTAALVKYRVPRRQGLEKHVAPLQDAQRAMSLVRHRATELHINPKRTGVIGFSAGGHLAASLSTSTKRTYDDLDSADKENLRPDFALLIYPAYLMLTNNLTQLSPEVSVTTNHPHTFLVMTQDDPLHVENVLAYSLALKQAKIPFELHIYPSGGHGYGLRKTESISATWPNRAEEWLRAQGLLQRK